MRYEPDDSAGTVDAVRSDGIVTGRVGGDGISHGTSGGFGGVGVSTELKCKKPVLKKDLSW